MFFPETGSDRDFLEFLSKNRQLAANGCAVTVRGTKKPDFASPEDIVMAFHVPFEYRRNGQPIYIGFSNPPRRKAFNWWAFFGFPFSLFALLTAGVLSPIALMMNLVALRKKPRRLATAGTVISLAGVAVLATVVFGSMAMVARSHQAEEMAMVQKANKKQAAQTAIVLNEVSGEFELYRDNHDGALPDWIDANMVALSYKDAWGHELRFDAEKDFAILRSPGPDKQFDTTDDITRKIEGKTDRQILLDLN